MAPIPPEAVAAVDAMKELGFSSQLVKHLLKGLLKVYDYNWELIEADNYQVLVDAILASQESEDVNENPGKRARIEEDSLRAPPHPRQERVESSIGNLRNHSYIAASRQMSESCVSGSPNFELPVVASGTASPAFNRTRDQKKGKERFPDAACKDRATNKVARALQESSTVLEITSSAYGEVKLSFRCSSALFGRSDFHIPSMEHVVKMAENKCLSSYRTAEKRFSLMHALKELCQSFMDLGFGSKRENRENALEIAPVLKPLISSDLDTIDSLHAATSDQHPQHSHVVNDIAKGEERVQISVVNDLGSVPYPPSFHYIPCNMVYQNAYVNFSLARIGDEDCCPDCVGDCLAASLPCACARETGGVYAYTLDGLLKDDFLEDCISRKKNPQKHHFYYCKQCPLERHKNEVKPDPCKGHPIRRFVKECWSKCGCNKQCGNRVVQRGITCNLQVFLTDEEKGWGLRALDELPKGTFVCEYVGEVVTNIELYDRNDKSTGSARHTYPVLLDADWGSEGVLKDEEALCLDATFYGNVARFINHRCFDANLIEVPVEVETPDHHYYHIAFFTTRKVEALEELCWDYGIDFYDKDHPVKAFRCRCQSKFCRDVKRVTRNKVRALVLG